MPLGRTWLTHVLLWPNLQTTMDEVSEKRFWFGQVKKRNIRDFNPVTVTQWPEFITAVERSIRYWRCVHYVYKEDDIAITDDDECSAACFLRQGDDDLHIADREDADLSPHLALVPVLVQLLLQPARIKGECLPTSVVGARGYWMIYGGPGFLAFSFSLTSLPSLSCQQLVSISQSPCVSPIQRGGGRGWEGSQIIRQPAPL